MPAIPHFLSKLFSTRPPVRARFEEDDNTFLVGGRPLGAEPRERGAYDRDEVLRQSLEAWRDNPIARRIVALTTQYVVGAGIRLTSAHPASHAFLERWWNHRLNGLPMRVYEWCDELTRSGELFLLVSTDAAGMSYVRAVAACEIESVETAPNDVAQERAYYQRPPDPAAAALPGAAIRWPAYDEDEDRPAPNGSFAPVMLHYAVNRPVGTVHGESDLAPLLKWLARYAGWLEDRARLNRYRNSFLYVIKSRWNSEAERNARQISLSATPPSPGSFLVVDESETWDVLNPRLESSDANQDGLALKKMLAAGAGLPLHFLAEPESATRTTAESAGGPTYRHFEQRQEFFLWLLADLGRVALRRRALVDPAVDPAAPIQASGGDLSARDNASLAVATSAMVSALGDLRDRAIIDDAEMLRMAYRFAGEVTDIETLLARGKAAGPRPARPKRRRVPGKPAGVEIDGETGEVKGLPRGV